MKRILSILIVAITLGAVASATIYSRQVSVTGTATRLDANTSGESLIAVNQGVGSVFAGGAAVTTSTGLELKPGASVTFTLSPGEQLYGITSGSTYRVDVLESGR